MSFIRNMVKIYRTRKSNELYSLYQEREREYGDTIMDQTRTIDTYRIMLNRSG